MVGRVEVAGHRIAFRREGEGPAVLLLHGGLSDGREWGLQVEALAEAFDVVAWDAPGCGGSSDPPEDFRMADYADCVAGLAGALGLGRPHLVGLSFGSTLALEVACRHPHLPRSLVLASAYAGWAGSLPPDEVAARLQGALLDVQTPPERLLERWLPDLLSLGATEEFVEEMTAILLDIRPSGVRPMARAMAECDLRPALGAIRAPALLVYGDADRRSPASVAADLHARIPGSTLAFLPGAGHLCHVEAPEAFTAVVRDFLLTQG